MSKEEDERDDDETSADESGQNDGATGDGEAGDGEAGDGEASDGEAGDGEAGDGEASDGEAEGEGAASATGAAASAKKSPSRLSAGARLAAAKAAKAAKKAAKKAQIAAEAQAVTSPSGAGGGSAADDAPIEQLKASSLGQAATRAGEWASANQTIAIGIAAALVIALVGYAGWNFYAAREAAAAGALLAEAVEIANAEIVAADDDDDDGDARTFESAAARAEAALAAYRRVLSEYPSSGAAGWARLGEARVLAETGELEEARSAYRAAIRDHGDDPFLALRAYEGAGFTFEAEEDWAHAREEYESIETIEDGAYRVVGRYHLARLRIASGDRVGAQTALEELIEEIEAATDGPEPPFPYVLAQAQARLRELDPSSAGGSGSPLTVGGPGGGGLPEGISPEVLEALRRAMEGAGGGGAAE